MNTVSAMTPTTAAHSSSRYRCRSVATRYSSPTAVPISRQHTMPTARRSRYPGSPSARVSTRPAYSTGSWLLR